MRKTATTTFATTKDDGREESSISNLIKKYLQLNLTLPSSTLKMIVETEREFSHAN